MKKTGVFLLALMMVVGMMGCTGDSMVINVAGTWSGYNFATFRYPSMTLTQDGKYLSGTVTDDIVGETWPVTGTIHGTDVDLSFCQEYCWFINATVNLEGTYMEGTASSSKNSGVLFKWNASKL